MTSMTTLSRPVRLAAAVLALSASGVALGACTGDDADPTPSGSASATSPSTTPSATATDQSATVLELQLPAVAGSTSGSLDNAPLGSHTATLNVAKVRATPDGTLLTHWYTGPDTKLLLSQGERGWENLPTLVDVPGKKVYEPVTYTSTQGDQKCICTDAAYVRGTPQPRTILYPPLPEGVATIEVRQAGFDKPISLPVTR